MLFYKKIYNNKKNNLNPLRFFLISIRFLLPTTTCLYRFFLDPNRIYYVHLRALDFLEKKQSLFSALIKIHDAHLDNGVLIMQEYSEIIHDGLRRDVYFFDPTAFKLTQTIDSSFTKQPGIKEQLTRIQVHSNAHKEKKQLHKNECFL